MAKHILDEKKHVDTSTGFRLRYVKSKTEYFTLHAHNYYEIFLTLTDNICHFVNGKKNILSRGSLLFIRDFDEHDYIGIDGKSFEFLNLSFSRETFDSLVEFLGEGIDWKSLLSEELPPTVSLLPRDTEKLFYDLLSLKDAENTKEAKSRARILIANIFMEYFCFLKKENSDIPLWLEIAYEKMKKPKNFIAGSEKLVLLGGKSREHTAREMKRCYGITITEYVNELRLNYAVNLFKQSNLSVTDICYECGFSNLSWFYKLFYEKYHKSPAKFKKEL